MPTYIHAYIHTYKHASIHTYIDTYIYIYMVCPQNTAGSIYNRSKPGGGLRRARAPKKVTGPSRLSAFASAEPLPASRLHIELALLKASKGDFPVRSSTRIHTPPYAFTPFPTQPPKANLIIPKPLNPSNLPYHLPYP